MVREWAEELKGSSAESDEVKQKVFTPDEAVKYGLAEKISLLSAFFFSFSVDIL
jgi:hypothetical protein